MWQKRNHQSHLTGMLESETSRLIFKIIQFVPSLKSGKQKLIENWVFVDMRKNIVIILIHLFCSHCYQPDKQFVLFVVAMTNLISSILLSFIDFTLVIQSYDDILCLVCCH